MNDFLVSSKSYAVSLCGLTQTIPVPEKALALAQEVLEIAQQFPDLPRVQQYAETARAVLQAISE